jgi:hypothetical protein
MHDSKLVKIFSMFSVVRRLKFLHTAIITHKPLEITNFYSYQSPAKSVHVWVCEFLLQSCILLVSLHFGNFLWQFSCINKLNNTCTISQPEVTMISVSWALPGNTATYSMVHSAVHSRPSEVTFWRVSVLSNLWGFHGGDCRDYCCMWMVTT